MDENERGLALANEFLDVAKKCGEWLINKIDSKDGAEGTPIIILMSAIAGLAANALMDQHMDQVHRTAAVAAICTALAID